MPENPDKLNSGRPDEPRQDPPRPLQVRHVDHLAVYADDAKARIGLKSSDDGSGQVLVVIDRSAAGWSRQCHEAVRFVPLRSGTA